MKGAECSWNGVTGRCVKLFRCLTAAKDVEKKIYPPICTFEGRTPIVCCTDCQLVQDTRLLLFEPVLGILMKTGTNKARDKCLDYIYQIDFPCKQYEPNITYAKALDKGKHCTFLQKHRPNTGSSGASGGQDAKRGDYPHMALLGFGDTVETASWLCGGTLISDKYILTAAHCLSASRIGPVRYIGLGMLKRSDPEEYWQRYNVKRSIAHPSYNSPSKYHDIALLESDRRMTFNIYARPACLHVDDKPDSYAFATGWGALGHKQELADTLQTVQVSRFDAEACSSVYVPHRLLLNGFDNTTQMCYGDMKKAAVPTDTCGGDSGGPLQSLQHEDCVFTIIGVTSYGLQCGLSGGSGMYTRVRHYVPWIESIVWP